MQCLHNLSIGVVTVCSGGTAAAVPPPLRHGNPALCGSCPLVISYYCRLGICCDLCSCLLIVCLICLCTICSFSTLILLVGDVKHCSANTVCSFRLASAVAAVVFSLVESRQTTTDLC